MLSVAAVRQEFPIFFRSGNFLQANLFCLGQKHGITALLFPKSHLAWGIMCMIFSTVASPVSFQEGKASSCGCSEPMDVIALEKEG